MPDTSKRIKLLVQPGAVLRAHVSGQGLCHSTDTTRLLRTEHPYFKRMRTSILNVANSDRVGSESVLDHKRPAGVTFWENRSIRPAQAAQHRRRHCNYGTTISQRMTAAGRRRTAIHDLLLGW